MNVVDQDRARWLGKAAIQQERARQYVAYARRGRRFITLLMFSTFLAAAKSFGAWSTYYTREATR